MDYTLSEQYDSLMAMSIQDPFGTVSNSGVLESETTAIGKKLNGNLFLPSLGLRPKQNLLLHLQYHSTASKWDFLEVMNMYGCGEKCASTKHHLSPTDALRYHEHFDSLSQMAKKQWLLDYFIMTSSGKDKELDIPLLGKHNSILRQQKITMQTCIVHGILL